MYFGRNEYSTFVADRDGATIERDVMQTAQTESILENVRPVQRVPAEVGRVETNRIPPEKNAPVTHSAPVLVRREHLRAEVSTIGRIPQLRS